MAYTSSAPSPKAFYRRRIYRHYGSILTALSLVALLMFCYGDCAEKKLGPQEIREPQLLKPKL